MKLALFMTPAEYENEIENVVEEMLETVPEARTLAPHDLRAIAIEHIGPSGYHLTQSELERRWHASRAS